MGRVADEFVRRVATFQSDRFNTTVPKEYFVNPCCFGDDLCNWMISKLESEGIKCDTEPGQEDFGWYFNFKIEDVDYCLICGYREGDENEPGDWVFWIERSRGFFASLFGGRDKGIDVSVTRIIHGVLSASPEIKNIRWHLKKDFDRGQEEAGSETPG